LLAFIVMYNLSNVNVSERRRELATLKVLGFYPQEMRTYVNRESAILTFMGIILGMFAGKGLHGVLIKYCSVGIVMYGQELKWYCFLIAAAATALFSVFAALAMRNKITSVDMVESLKSIE
nr:ABC transporter permease [Clostridia bacterium]